MSSSLRLCCIIALLLGLCIAVYSAVLRIREDSANKRVIVLVDWRSLNSLPESGADAKLSDRSSWQTPWSLLAQIPGAQLCYGEETLGDLLESGILRPAPLVSSGPVFEVAAPAFNDDVAKGAARHGYWTERSAATHDRLFIQFPDLAQDDLNSLPVCWREDVIKLAQAHGANVVLRPAGTDYMGENGLADTLEFCRHQSLVLFEGSEVLGNPQRLKEVADKLKSLQQTFGWIEFDEQDGGGQLASLCAPNIVRVHSIPAEEMSNYDVPGAVERLLRAVQERGIRCLYLRPFETPGYYKGAEDAPYPRRLFATNAEYFKTVAQELGFAGYVIGDTALQTSSPPGWLDKLRNVTSGLALGGALALLLALWLPGLAERWRWLALGAGFALGLAAVASGAAQAVLLLGIGIVFPTLGFWAMLWLYQKQVQDRPPWCPRRTLYALAAFLGASLFSTAGGLLIHATLWDARTMQHIGQFRGVTIALALPILLLAAYAWQAETLQDAFDGASLRLTDYWLRFTSLWNAPIRYGDVAFILLAVGALGVVLLRSGNDSAVGASHAETAFRGSLEQFFAVRPRTKELLGHPLFIAFLLSLPWRSRLSLMIGLGAMLGQVSILNTFCHIHTPLAITLQRVGIGLLVGVGSGLLVALLMQAGAWMLARVREGALRSG